MSRKAKSDDAAQRADIFADVALDLSDFRPTPARKPQVDREVMREASERIGFPSRDPAPRTNGSAKPPPRPPRRQRTGKGATLKERAHQLSVYLDPAVYDALREIAHAERAKLHTLILEGVDAVLRRRGSPSIKQLTASGATGSQDDGTTGS